MNPVVTHADIAATTSVTRRRTTEGPTPKPRVDWDDVEAAAKREALMLLQWRRMRQEKVHSMIQSWGGVEGDSRKTKGNSTERVDKEAPAVHIHQHWLQPPDPKRETGDGKHKKQPKGDAEDEDVAKQGELNSGAIVGGDEGEGTVKQGAGEQGAESAVRVSYFDAMENLTENAVPRGNDATVGVTPVPSFSTVTQSYQMPPMSSTEQPKEYRQEKRELLSPPHSRQPPKKRAKRERLLQEKDRLVVGKDQPWALAAPPDGSTVPLFGTERGSEQGDQVAGFGRLRAEEGVKDGCQEKSSSTNKKVTGCGWV
ncbi:unnamed protein product, partial [Choristocarpus tenellus]